MRRVTADAEVIRACAAGAGTERAPAAYTRWAGWAVSVGPTKPARAPVGEKGAWQMKIGSAVRLMAALVVVAAISTGCGGRLGHPDGSASLTPVGSTRAPSSSDCGSAPPLAFAGRLPLTACSMGPVRTLRPRAATLPVVTTSDEIRVIIGTGSNSYQAGQAIDVTATLEYLGPEASIKVGGSGGGIVHFLVHQLDGDLDAGGAMTADCVTYELKRNVVQRVPFRKSGGYANDGSANSEFAKQYLSGPMLTLPPGIWEIVARLDYVNGAGCSGSSNSGMASVVVSIA